MRQRYWWITTKHVVQFIEKLYLDLSQILLMKKILLFLLFFVVSFVVKAQETKVDTIFIGKIKNESIKKYIKKKATVFILVRHGEKQYEGKNPSLSVEGNNRAQRLSALLKEVVL